MGADDYNNARIEMLGCIKQMIVNTRQSPSSVSMQYNQKFLDEIHDFCIQTRDSLNHAMIGALTDLEQGSSIINFLNPALIKHHKEHSFPESATGGALSAVYDAALLISTLDASSHHTHLFGAKKNAVREYADKTLSYWLLATGELWRDLAQKENAVTKSPFKTRLPKADRPEASPLNFLRIFAQTLCFSNKLSSPHKSKTATVFGKKFATKHWTTDQNNSEDTNTASSDEMQICPLIKLSEEFQEWYFGVGQTQLSDDIKRRQAEEKTGIILRDMINAHAKKCSHTCRDSFSCAAALQQDIERNVPTNEPFRQNCMASILPYLRK